VLKPLAVAVALAVLLRLVLGPGALGYDAGYALVYGEDLLSPDYDGRYPPTPHPLANVVGFAASLFGDAAPDLLLALSFVAFASLGVAAFEVGRRSFGVAAGVAFAAILLTRPLLVVETLQGSVDVPFLALVLAALSTHLAAGERPRTVLALLALAGLIRPEAWLLSLAYAAYVRRDVALAFAAPVLWALFDLVTTGDPLHSLTGTQDLAVQLERERGLGSAFDVLPASLETILEPTVLWAGLAAGVIALVVAQDRAEPPVAVLLLALLGFLALGVFDLPLLVRYLLVPAAMLGLLCAAGIAAAAWLPRATGVVAGVVVAGVVAAGLPATVDEIDDAKRSAAFARDLDRSLHEVADRAPRDCGPVQVATDRAVPVLAYLLGVDPSEIAVVPPVEQAGLLFAARAEVVGTDIDFDRSKPAADLRLPRGFTRVAESEWWTLGARC
jgi:hypothetical protein